MAMTIKAYKIASEAHLNQKRHGGESYINHPIRVALRCVDNMTNYSFFRTNDPDVLSENIQAALMHDVIENTDVTIDDIKTEGFTENVTGLLETLTRKENITYSQYISDILYGNDYPIAASLIKISDIEDNYPTATDSMKKRYDKALSKLKHYLENVDQ